MMGQFQLHESLAHLQLMQLLNYDALLLFQFKVMDQRLPSGPKSPLWFNKQLKET